MKTLVVFPMQISASVVAGANVGTTKSYVTPPIVTLSTHPTVPTPRLTLYELPMPNVK